VPAAFKGQGRYREPELVSMTRRMTEDLQWPSAKCATGQASAKTVMVAAGLAL